MASVVNLVVVRIQLDYEGSDVRRLMDNALVIIGGQVLAALFAAGGVIAAALIARESVQNYREQRNIGNREKLTMKTIVVKEKPTVEKK